MKLTKTLILLAATLSACTNHGDTYLVCGEVEYVKEFPKELTVSDAPIFAQDLMGMVGMEGVDTLCIAIQDGLDHFVGLYSFNTGEKLGEIFKQGQGPGEYSSWPSLVRTFEKDDSLYAEFSASKELITINLTSTLSSGAEQIVAIHTPTKLWGGSYYPLATGDTLIKYMKEYDKPGDYRELISGTERIPIPNLGDLEAEWIDVDPNALRGIVYPIDGDSVIVEAMNLLNQIMVYSPYDPKLRKTICVGDHLTPVEKDGFFARMNRTTNYDGVQAWNDYVIFLYAPVKEREFMDNKGQSQLQIFTQKMQPVARIQLPLLISSFYLNADGVLFGFSSVGETETIYKWDISPLIAQFGPTEQIGVTPRCKINV